MAAPDAQQPGTAQAAAQPANEPMVPIHFGTTAHHDLKMLTNDEGEHTGAFKHIPRPDLGQQTTTVSLSRKCAEDLLAGRNDFEALMTGRDALSAYRHIIGSLGHETSAVPEWVHSPNAQLGEKVAAFLGLEHSPERPEWEHGKPLPPMAGGSPQLIVARVDPTAVWRAIHEPQIGTKAGRDAFLEQDFGTSAQPAAFNYFALSVNNTALTEEESLSSETTLPEEYAVAGGGLIRKQAEAFAHTSNKKEATLKVIFTANGTDKTFPLVFNKFALFNKATSGGTMAIVVKLSSAMTHNASGDKGEITETVEVTAIT